MLAYLALSRFQKKVALVCWRREWDCSAFTLPPRKPHPSFHSGLPFGHPAQAVLAGQTQVVSSTHPHNQIFKGTLAGTLKYLAERVGFEPTVTHNATPDFESGTFDHSDTSPKRINNNGAHSTSNLQFRAEWPYAKPITTLASGIGQLEPAAGCVRSTASGMECRESGGYHAESRTGRGGGIRA